MMSGGSRKSGRSNDYVDENSPNKKPKEEKESLPPFKYFSMKECPFGERCQFIHVVPTGLNDDVTINFNVDESIAESISGVDGRQLKLITLMSRVKLSIKDHESESPSKNILIEGTHESVGVARELMCQFTKGDDFELLEICPGTEFKTELCARFSQGFCPDGAGCHSAHGATELRMNCTVFK